MREFIILACLACVALTPFIIKHHVYFNGQVDFNHVYIAASLYNNGQLDGIYGNSPYGHTRHSDWMALEQTLPDGIFDNFFTYLPLYIVPYSILVRVFSYVQLVHIHFYLNLLLIVALAAILSLALQRPLWQKALLVSLITCCNASLFILELGQNILICGLFVWLYLHAVLKQNKYHAALFLVFAVLCKFWAVLFLFLPLARRQYFLAAYSLVAIAFMVLVQYLWQPELMQQYFALLKSFSGSTYVSHFNYSFVAILRRFTMPVGYSNNIIEEIDGLPVYIPVLQLLAIGILGLVGWIGRGFHLKIACNLGLIFVIVSIFWSFYFILAIPVQVSTYFTFSNYVKRRVWLHSYLALLLLAFMFDMVFHLWLFSGFYGLFSQEATYQIFYIQCLLPLFALFGTIGIQAMRKGAIRSDWRKRLFDFRPNVG